MKLWALLLFCFLVTMTWGQDLKVVEPLHLDLFEVVGSNKTDANGDPCALVKVLLPIDGAQFEGSIVNTQFKINEYWCYMTSGTKRFRIKFTGCQALDIIVPRELEPLGLQPNKCYVIKLELPEQILTGITVNSASQQKQMLTISFTPSDAVVLIDNKMYNSTNGKVTGMLPVGRHYVTIAAVDYESYEGSITLKDTSPCEIEVHLKKTGSEITDLAISEELNSTIMQPKSMQTNELPSETSKYLLNKLDEGKRLYNSKDYISAYMCFKTAAEAGNAEAQCLLGLCYFLKKGVKRSFSHAAVWFRKSAEQSNADAQQYLGFCYYLGLGVKKNHTEACNWFCKSAGQGNAAAQYNLGYCYEKGKGVKKDIYEAIKWYHKSAGQGFEKAKKKVKKYSRL